MNFWRNIAQERSSVKQKKVLFIDDVLSSGTALKNSIPLIEKEGGIITAGIVALDRQEQEEGQQVSSRLEKQLNLPIHSISNLDNLISFLESSIATKDIAKKLKTFLSK